MSVAAFLGGTLAGAVVIERQPPLGKLSRVSAALGLEGALLLGLVLAWGLAGNNPGLGAILSMSEVLSHTKIIADKRAGNP